MNTQGSAQWLLKCSEIAVTRTPKLPVLKDPVGQVIICILTIINKSRI